ncbi:MAG TPA: hypothetical protein VK155_05800 [Bacteroidales bacterium]|jgi:hypothetical protein|nr:hypothetical protein [Bacteroidales bacterium]
MIFIAPKSRFNDLQEDFLKDTGLSNVQDNLELYTQYVIARFTDINNRLLTDTLNEMRELQKNVKKL